MSHYVYLCGPIAGLTYDEARYGWRKDFADMMPDHIQCLSPMRQEDELMSEKGKLGNEHDHVEAQAKEHNSVTISPRGIVAKDKFDTLRSDLIISNFLNAGAMSGGSFIEFGWADAYQIPIIMVIEGPENPNYHAMAVEMSSFVVDSTEKAAEITKQLLTPGV